VNIVLLYLKLKLKLFFRRYLKSRTSKIFTGIGVLYLGFLACYIFTVVRKGSQFCIDLIGLEPTLWLCSLGISAILLMTVVSDLFLSQTHDVAQRGSDAEFVQILPVKFETFMLMKSLERMTIDISALGFLLPALLGLAAGLSGTVFSYVLALILFVILELLFGMVITLVNFALARFYPASTVRNMVQIANVVFMLFGFCLGGLLVSRGVHLARTGQLKPSFFSDLLAGSEWLQILFNCYPVYWIIKGFHELRASFFTGMAWCTAFLLFCAVLWWLCWKAGQLFQDLGWTYQAEEKPAVSSQAAINPRTGLFSGIVGKDLKLLAQDKGFLVNGLVLPLAFFFFYGYVLMQQGTPRPLATVTFLTLGIMYFHFFGAINSIGFEKKAIWIIRSLPLTPRQILSTKAFMWSSISLIIYLPMFLLVAFMALFTFTQILAGFAWLMFAALAVAHLGVAISALYPKFDAKFLQGGSTGIGKIVMAALTMPLVAGLVMWPFARSVTIGSIAFFLLLTWAMFLKAEDRFRLLDETEEVPTPAAVLGDAFQYLFFFFVLNSGLNFLLGLWPFKGAEPMITAPVALLVAGLLMSLFILRYFRKHAEAAGLSLPMAPKKLGTDLALGLGSALLLLGVLYPLLQQVLYLSTPPSEWRWTLYAAALIIAPIWEEIFFRGFLHLSLVKVVKTPVTAAFLSAFVFALVHPPAAVPAAFLIGLLSAYLLTKRKSLFPCVVLHVLYNCGVLVITMVG